MTEMTFAQSIDYLKAAYKKPSSSDKRYDALKNKYRALRSSTEDLFGDKLSELTKTTVRIKVRGRNWEVVKNGKTVFNSCMSCAVYESYYRKLVTLSKAVENDLIKFIGCYMMNRPEEVSTEDMAIYLSDIKEIVSKATESFAKELLAVNKEVYLIEKRVENFRDAIKARDNITSSSFYACVKAWKKEFGLKEGTVVIAPQNGCSVRKTVSYTKELKNGLNVYFTDGTRTNVDNVEWANSMRLNCEELAHYTARGYIG